MTYDTLLALNEQAMDNFLLPCLFSESQQHQRMSTQPAAIPKVRTRHCTVYLLRQVFLPVAANLYKCVAIEQNDVLSLSFFEPPLYPRKREEEEEEGGK